MAEFVSTVVGSNVTMTSVDSTVAEVHQQMQKYKRRCMTVVGDRRNPIGIVVYSDILKHRYTKLF